MFGFREGCARSRGMNLTVVAVPDGAFCVPVGF